MNELYTLNNEIKKNERDIESLIEKIKIVPTDIVPDIAKEIQKLKQKNIELTEKTELLETNKNSLIQDSENAKLVLNILDTYCKRFDELDLLQKRTIIKLLFSSAYSDGNNLVLNVAGTRESSRITSLPLGDNCE